MKINYTTKNNRISASIEAESVKDTFKRLAEFQEVFDECCCGLCSNEELQFVVRTVDSNDYYELRCKKCSAKLAFGQHKTGGSLFPKRKEHTSSKGWHKWNGQT